MPNLSMQQFKAIALDAFGTVVHIPGYRKPYRQLIDYFKSQGLSFQPGDSDQLMTMPVELSAVGQHFGVEIPPEVLEHADIDLQYDVRSIALFDDSLRTISKLQERGIKVAICSNLALPYGAPVKALLPHLDAYAWSYEAGAIKPSPAIYDYLCRKLKCLPHQVLMIGDTLEADYFGPRRFGMQSLHLSRKAESTVSNSLHSLDDLFA